MRIRTMIVAGLTAIVIPLVGAAPAWAGEVTGPPGEDGFASGGPTGIWGNAKSECSFSGQNAPHPGKDPGKVQSYGALVKLGLKDVLPSPGVACNGHLSPYDWTGH